MKKSLLDFDAHSENEPRTRKLWRHSMDEFIDWCKTFQLTDYGRDALTALSRIAPLEFYDPGTFNVLYACFAASRYNPRDDRKRFSDFQSRKERAVEQRKAIEAVRKAIKKTIQDGITMFPPFDPEEPQKIVAYYPGSYPATSMRVLDLLLSEFDERLKNFTAARELGVFGNLLYNHFLPSGKGSNSKPKVETMLMFHLTLLFRLWPPPPLHPIIHDLKLCQKQIPKTGKPHYPLTAKFVLATFPPQDDGASGQIVDAEVVQNRIKALPPLRYAGW